MRLIHIPVPEENIEQVANALVGLNALCPRHGNCAKMLVVVDECQWQLLQLIELTGHGRVEIDVAEGRPSNIHHYVDIAGVQVRQDYRTSKDDIAKVNQLVALLKNSQMDSSKNGSSKLISK